MSAFCTIDTAATEASCRPDRRFSGLSKPLRNLLVRVVRWKLVQVQHQRVNVYALDIAAWIHSSTGDFPVWRRGDPALRSNFPSSWRFINDFTARSNIQELLAKGTHLALYALRGKSPFKLSLSLGTRR